jgi:urea transport system substrate-binding protein
MLNQINRRKFILYGSAAIGIGALTKGCTQNEEILNLNQTGETIKVGILHSLTGTMAFSEKSLVNATQLAIAEINKSGGVLGKQIEAILEDGASDSPTFAEKAKKLIDQDRVVVVFGCWTSASRKAVLPIFEAKNHLLFYPLQYEGQECSKNVFYTGATPNQQIEPSVDWLLKNKGREFFLVGSDYLFPKTANSIIKAQLSMAKGGKVVGEEYIPLGDSEVAKIINKIKQALPKGGVIYNSLNGDSNVSFFKQLLDSGLTADKYPTMSVSVSEEEVKAIGVEFMKGHFAAWNYFMSVDNPANKQFVDAFKAMYGADKVTNDPMEASYIAVNIWKQAIEKAGKADDLEAVRNAILGQVFDAPEGMVKMENSHHLSKFVRIGEVGGDGQFKIVFESKSAAEPSPWNQYLAESKGFYCDYSDKAKGRKFKKP